MTRRGQLDVFIAWLMGSGTQHGIDSSARTFRRHHSWCWNVEPVVGVTGEIYDQVQLDGTYLAHGWCLLLAIDGATGIVIAWQWCDTEKTAAWEALLARIPPPRVAVIDGGAGLASALRSCWPQTRIQRCLVHVQRNIRTLVTMRPRSDAGKAIRALSLALTRITTADQARVWEVNLHLWHQAYAPLVNAKTYLKDGDIHPAWARAGTKWWWTHDRLRKAYRLLERLTRQQVLFTYLDPQYAGLTIASTTNRIEGGANAPIKDLLRRHRGMTTDHQRRAIEWWCYLHSTLPRSPASLIKPEHWQPVPPPPNMEHIGPTAYDTGLTTEEGLWIRKGWAGRA